MSSNLKSGFRVCGIFPFNANAIPYCKLLFAKVTDTNITSQENEEAPHFNQSFMEKSNNGLDNLNIGLLNQLENQLSHDILTKFRTCGET